MPSSSFTLTQAAYPNYNPSKSPTPIDMGALRCEFSQYLSFCPLFCQYRCVCWLWQTALCGCSFQDIGRKQKDWNFLWCSMRSPFIVMVFNCNIIPTLALEPQSEVGNSVTSRDRPEGPDHSAPFAVSFKCAIMLLVLELWIVWINQFLSKATQNSYSAWNN